MSDDTEAEYGLVMPFVACQSKGGPYDDVSFAAGYSVGSTDAALAFGLLLDPKPVYTALLPQLDLVAMRHGYKLKVLDGDDHWSTVCFVPDLTDERAR